MNKWRKTTVHHTTFSLIDDVKETWDNYDNNNGNEDNHHQPQLTLPSVRESVDIDFKSYEANNAFKMKDEREGKVIIEEWKCASCQQIYATMWPKCPGCLRSNTHYVYNVNQ